MLERVWPGCAGGVVRGPVDLVCAAHRSLRASTVCSALAGSLVLGSLSPRGTVPWITEQLDIRTGIRHWDSEGP